MTVVSAVVVRDITANRSRSSKLGEEGYVRILVAFVLKVTKA
jgi:hypothetical protein